MSDIRGYHHLSLSVTDLDRSTAWYRDTLGFEVHSVVESAGFRRHRMRAGEPGVTLTLTAHDEPAAPAFDERRPGMDHVAFDVGDIATVEALKGRFETLGVEHSEIRRMPNGVAAITLRDPDNIQLEVFGAP